MDSPSLHDTVAASAVDVAAAPPRSSSRRRLFGAGLGGVLAALSPAFVRGATAAPNDSGPDGSAAQQAPTTTAPKRPTDDDLVILRFAQSAELAARDLYDAALASESLDEDRVELFRTIREAHEAYGQSLAGVIGRSATGEPDADLSRTLGRGFRTGSTETIAAAGAELENTLAATHRAALGELVGTHATGLLASIIVIEGRHAAVLASLAGASRLDEMILNDAEPLEPRS